MPVILGKVETVAVIFNGRWLRGPFGEIDAVASFLTEFTGHSVFSSDPRAVEAAMKQTSATLARYLPADIATHLTYPASLVMYGTVDGWVRHVKDQLGTPEIKLELR